MSSNTIYQSKTEKFIERATMKHGDKFDYSLAKYKTKCDIVRIICPKHGEFQQRPDVHISSKHGCPKCFHEVRGRHKKLAEDKVLDAFKKSHGEKYSYPNFIYEGNTTPIKIQCPTHGIFEQTPKSHKKGHGCPACAEEQRITSKQTKVGSVLKRLKKVHGEKYDYSCLEQPRNMHEKIKIICPKHGVFEQSIAGHLSGRGCRKCAYDRVAEKSRVEYGSDCETLKFYLVRLYDENDEFLKIGITKNTPEYRLRQCGYNIEVIKVIEDDPDKIIELEELIIETLSDVRYRIHHLKEAISNGWTECFRLKDLGKIKLAIEETQNL